MAPAQDARAIIQSSYRAMGCSIVGSNTSITATGTLKSDASGAQMRVTIYSQGFDRLRSELDTPREHKVTIVNGGKGQIQHQDGHITPLAGHNTSHQRPSYIPCLSRLNSRFEQISGSYLRSESSGSETLDVIEVSPASIAMPKELLDHAKTTFWISRTTGYVARMRYINSTEQDSKDTEEVDVDYMDYRTVDGLAVPFKQQTLSRGQVVLELTLDSVHLNVAPAEFTLR